MTGHSYDIVSPLLPGNNNGEQPTDARGLFGGMRDTAHNNPHSHVPSGRIDSRPMDSRKFEEVSPFCVSANDLINPLPPSLFTGSGWLAHHPPAGSSASAVYAHYFYSTQPTSRLRVPIQVGAGDVAIYYLKEPRGDVEDTGSEVECWVDDNYGGAKRLGNAADVGDLTPVYA